mmetsp:Transcript_21310/g.47365  ORF Transcript_21310/g.47365 Transcript_21310/m.47365 type:complete len:87 (-) Transcript_21310:198-458(-)
MSTQQLSIASSYHLHGPFQERRGSTDNAFKQTTNVVSPQNAGSGCVCNCSIKGKNVCAPPPAKALANRRFPSALENEITVSGSCLR